MSKYNIKGPVSGDGHHFGDIYNLNSEEYIAQQPRSYTELESDLVTSIINHVRSKEEKKDLLESLDRILDEKLEETSKNDQKIWKQWIKTLSDEGLKSVASKFVTFLSSKFGHWDFSDCLPN